MLNVLGIILYVVAGFFFYFVCMLGFVDRQSPGGKWGPMFGFMVLAVVVLLAALASRRFSNWKRETGIVLLSASGFMVFMVFTVICLLMTDEFREMMQPDTMEFFNDYLTGGATIVGYAGLGLLLVKKS